MLHFQIACYNIQIVALYWNYQRMKDCALEMSVIESRCYFGEIDNSGLCKWQNVCLALQTQLGFGSADFFFPRLTALFYIPGQACIAIRITSLLSVIFVTITHVIKGCYKVFIEFGMVAVINVAVNTINIYFAKQEAMKSY